MRTMNKLAFAVALLGGVATLPAHADIVKVDGSSTVYPITLAAGEEFQRNSRHPVKVTVGVSGTGGGFKKFCKGETDISDASRPILKKEMEACKEAGVQYFELPIAFDAITVVVNRSNDFIKKLSVADLKKIWEPAAEGTIRNWNQIDPAFPNMPLKLFGPGSESGTFDYFTEAAVGKAKSSRKDYVASEDDNVLVQGVARDKGALGYFGYAYYQENQKRMKAVGIVSGADAVLPSAKTVEDGSYRPFSRPIFIYVNTKSFADKADVREFVDFYMKNGARLSKEAKYVPLPARAYTLNAEHIAKKRIGTVFGGEEAIGIKIEELMSRETKM